MAIITIFKFSVFMQNFWGVSSSGQALAFSFDNVFPQVRNTMLVALWMFIGVESAVVVSGRARSQSVVRRSTMIGFMVVLILYVLISTLPFGVYSQSDLADMANPSAAAIMLDAFGTWGEILINAGVMISVLTSWLVWLLMLGEMPLAAARSGTFPKFFDSENKHNAPVRSLLVTTIVVQAALVLSLFTGSAWNVLITITGIMCVPCYLISTLFLCKVARKDYPGNIFAGKWYALATGATGAVFMVWLLYAAGLNYLALACILYTLGIPLYVAARKEDGQDRPFAARRDKAILIVMLILGAIGAVYSIMRFI
jgi:arginine:ornithine antiporter/lysine permease